MQESEGVRVKTLPHITQAPMTGFRSNCTVLCACPIMGEAWGIEVSPHIRFEANIIQIWKIINLIERVH